MIAVDTNLLVRYVTNDDPLQARQALAVLAGPEAVFVSRTVVLELEWVLRAAYKLPPEAIEGALLEYLAYPAWCPNNRHNSRWRWKVTGRDWISPTRCTIRPLNRPGGYSPLIKKCSSEPGKLAGGCCLLWRGAVGSSGLLRGNVAVMLGCLAREGRCRRGGHVYVQGAAVCK